MTKPVRVTIAVQNNLLLTMMEAKGIKNAYQLSLATKIGYRDASGLVNMTMSPVYKDGKWRASVIKVANYFGCRPIDIFADQQVEALENNSSTVEATYEELESLQASYAGSPCNIVAASELKEVLLHLVNKLKQRQRKVLILRFGLEDGKTHTLEEIAVICGMSRQGAQKSEAAALHRLQSGVFGRELVAAGANDAQILACLGST